METFTNPTSEEKKYLVPFEVGDSKIILYGQPIIMSMKSELIKTLLSKSDLNESIPLAPNTKIDSNILSFLWERLNGIYTPFEKLSIKEVLELWPLMNYLDINVKSEILSEYLKVISKHFQVIVHKYPEYESQLKDILGKVKLIDLIIYAGLYSQLDSTIKEKKSIPLIVMTPQEYGRSYGKIDSTRMDEALQKIGTEITESNGKKAVYIPSSLRPYGANSGYFSYPEYDEKYNAYVIRPLD